MGMEEEGSILKFKRHMECLFQNPGVIAWTDKIVWSLEAILLLAYIVRFINHIVKNQ